MGRIKKTFIYVLKDPDTLEVRYVGKSNEPKKRFSKHIRDCFNHKKKNTHKQNWIRKSMNNNVDSIRPILEILEEVDYNIWKEREIYWISKFRNDNINITNVTNGGDCPDVVNCKKSC